MPETVSTFDSNILLTLVVAPSLPLMTTALNPVGFCPRLGEGDVTPAAVTEVGDVVPEDAVDLTGVCEAAFDVNAENAIRMILNDMRSKKYYEIPLNIQGS